MSATYTSAASRDARRISASARRFDAHDVLLAATSCVCLLAIGLAFAGRVRTTSAEGVDLTRVTDAAQLEPVFETVFSGVEDRRLAARELTRFLVAQRESGDRTANVAAILDARVASVDVERAKATAYAERLRQARTAAQQARRPPPASLPVVTRADLAAIKPRLVVRSAEAFARATLWWAGILVIAFQLSALSWKLRAIPGDRVLLSAAHLLTGIGFALLLGRADPFRDVLLIVRYAQGVVVGLVLMAALSGTSLVFRHLSRFAYLPLVAAVSLSVLLLLLGDGPGSGGAKVNLGPVQPIEAIRFLLVLFIAGYFARRWELVRQISSGAGRDSRVLSWLTLPRADYLLPVGVGVGAALLLFFLQKDLGPALFVSCVFLALYALARGAWPMAAAGVITLIAGFVAGYRLQVSSTLAERIEMWRSPWDNGVGGGDQVAQAIWALASGGGWGTGLGLGATRYLPAGHTDLILSAAGEELGLAGLLAIVALYVVVAWRGFRAAAAAGTDHGVFLGSALTLFLVLPVLVMAAGLLGVIPLTGVVTPFLSYGGSAMAVNFAALAILSGLPGSGGEDSRADVDRLAPFRSPLRYLRGTLGLCGAALVLVLVNVQALRADDYAVRPHMSLQADGVRRYQYNPRILDIVATIPRGTVYDRAGLPLATEDGAVVAEARAAYRRLGVATPRACLDRKAALASRCYPLGGETFHVLGDASARLNWGATNTSYVERDREATLRGFDDRATAVPSTDAEGRPVVVVRRVFAALVPLLRHRHEADHPAMRVMRERVRDVRLTIDAGLQHRVASILAAYAARSKAGRAAAVVLDPATGAVLALVSVPWPALNGAAAGAPRALALPGSQDGQAALLDRARYGLYPPGSAFKLVTATAALRRDLRLAQARFTCGRLPDGRVGTRIPGGRPVRDDVLDAHAHGTIDMRAGMTHSCNAYFAQLALSLGPETLLDTAARLGISVVSSNPTATHLRATLPQAGYGQGDVLASPLRMARVASAIAADGLLREARAEVDAAAGRDEVLLTPEAAQMLGDFMRDAVLTGTGRGLREHPGRIAGKTGTAEVAGQPSHSWFVGFAPHGAATRRVAFAVLLENAGYGGRTAAPVAGEIVTAAMAAGLVR
jgi:cell division protein FtsW (lipid II flippase)